MQLILSGSSFLLPKNKSWNSLEKKFKLEFCDYGNWSGALINSKTEDAISVILFLDDLIDHKNKTEDEIKILLELFINLLVNRLSKSKSPILVFHLVIVIIYLLRLKKSLRMIKLINGS